MAEVFADSLVLPVVVLAILAWIVPKLLARVFAEGVRPLMALAFVSVLILFGLSGLFFWLLYVWQGAPVAELAEGGVMANVVYFGRLGLSAALIWAPIMVLSVSGLPRRWTKEIW